MKPELILLVFLVYTSLLFAISFITSRKSDSESYFLANRQSPWLVVAYGMIGASLSGVTFISVPGWVSDRQFSYMMLVIGYLLGYFIIARVLLPLYYRLQLTSIYSYLGDRFGFWSYKTGAFYFLLSRLIGASFRVFLVISVLQIFVFEALGVPFWVTTVVFMLLINLYTFRGGIKTIVWTDTLQTTFMLVSVVVTVLLIRNELGLTIGGMFSEIIASEHSKMVFTDWQDQRFFLKEFFSGAFIAIVMTGLDQDMMQKNLSCRNLRDAQKNIISLSWALIPVNLLFLGLGVLLILFAQAKGVVMPGTSDTLFPEIAFNHLKPVAGIVFIIGLISAAYSSADSALTALTTSFTVDFLGIKRKPHLTETKRKKIRYATHFSIAVLLIGMVLLFNAINNDAVISELFTIAGYTYGPLLGLFAFGLFTKRNINDRFAPLIAVASPAVCYILSANSEAWLGGYSFGFELLILNGVLMFLGLWLISVREVK